MNSKRVASIDIGSNAMRLLIADRYQGRLRTIQSDRASVRLGAEVFGSGSLSEETISRAVESIRNFKQKIDAAGVETFRAIGTSAMREADNADVFIARAEQQAGVKIEVIDGDEEARLVYLAVSETIEFSKGIDVLVDIGGGSVEVTIVKSGVIIFSESVKVGTVRLMRLFGSGQLSPQNFQHLVSEYSASIKAKIKQRLGDQLVQRCIGTGGNLETFLNLKQRFFNKSGTELWPSEMQQILELLQGYSVEERISRLGLRADRADVVVPAAIVMLHVLQASQAPVLLVPGVGVKEGVAYELMSGAKEDDPHFVCGNLVEGALEIGRKYLFDEAHASCVAKLALSIFEQVQDLHKLSIEGRKLLELAALLHDIGHFVSSRGHHKHSFYLIESAAFPGLTKREKIMVACIARYHRKRFPNLEHAAYRELGEEERLLVCRLAAILRIADGLDGDRRQRVTNVRLSPPEGSSKADLLHLNLEIEGQGDLLLDKWAVKSKSDLFEHIYGCRINIVS